MSSHSSSNQSQSPKSSLSQGLGIIVGLTVFGGFIGSYLLGAYGFENAIPYPYIVGFGFAALPTFVLLLAGRFTMRCFQKN